MAEKVTYRVIQSEDKQEFEKLVMQALKCGWKLGDFAIWTLSASSDHWIYFQTLYK